MFKSFFDKKKKEGNTLFSGMMIHAERDSVCMGDDVMAPNPMDARFEEDAMISELVDWLACYVPAMKNFEWEILCNNKMIGKLASGEDGTYKSELMIRDTTILELPANEVFCRIKRKR